MTIDHSPLPVARLRDDLERWISDHDMMRGVKFYTDDEWCITKGETMCAGASLHLLIEESPLSMVLNYPESRPDADTIEKDLTDFLESRGYWYEIGFSWSIHLFPLD